MIILDSFSGPVHVSINLTNKCNLNCSHCSGNYGIKNSSELDLYGWKRVIDFIVHMNVFTVNITGGEPTQSAYLFYLLDAFQKNNIYITISSNLMFDDDILLKLEEYKDIIRNIKVSIDGYNPQINAYIRKSKYLNDNDIFDKVNQNYWKLKKAGFNLSVTTVLHTELLNRLDRMASYIIRLRPQNWIVSPIVSVGRAYYNSSKIIPDVDRLLEPDYYNIESKLKKNGIGFSMVDFPSKEKNDPYGCPACNESIIINSDGTIAPCQLSLEVLPLYGFELPNILSYDYRNIWNCDAFKKFREAQQNGCIDCDLKSNCKRCIPQALRYFDDINAPTPYCISMAETLGLKNPAYWKNKIKKDWRQQ